MARQPAPGTGQDDAPPSVTPDWLTDEDWELVCASHSATELDLSADGEDDDPDSCVPPDWAELSVAEITAQARADGAGHGAMMARLLAAGLEDGYAHRRGDPPVPGCSPVRRPGSARAAAWTAPLRSPRWPCWPMRPPVRTGLSRM